MPVRIVQSKQNARLKELRRALDRPAREPGVPIAIEGPNLLDEALRTRLRIPCVFAAEDNQASLAALRLPDATEVLLVPAKLLRSVLSTENPQLLAALVEPPVWTWADLFTGIRPTLLIVLAGVQDPGNLGTILRSSEAFGAAGVICLPGTVSSWNPKALRASAGSAFRLPLVVSSADECFLRLRQHGVKVWTTALSSATPIDEADLSSSTALLIGNEGNGVPADIAAHAGGAITIPCPGRVESLNAAVAASVILYEASRQRRSLGRVLAEAR